METQYFHELVVFSYLLIIQKSKVNKSIKQVHLHIEVVCFFIDSMLVYKIGSYAFRWYFY